MSMAAAIAILRDAYPRQDFPDRSVALYAHELADLDDDEVTAAVRRLIRRSEWLPSIAEIRRDVAEARAGLPSEGEAWQMVKAGTYRLPPEVAGALHDVGGRWAVRTGHETHTRRAFIEAYRQRRTDTLLTVMAALPPSSVRELEAPTVAMLPESSRIRPRPVMERLMVRWSGRQVPDPTDAQCRDAVEVLRDGPVEGHDPLHEEAQRILDDADRVIGERLASAAQGG
jgi:hypothetical protein